MPLDAPLYPLAELQRRAKAEDLHVLARRLGLTHGTVRNAATHGLTERQADHWACALGFHPSDVWRDSWQDEGTIEVEFLGGAGVVEETGEILIVRESA